MCRNDIDSYLYHRSKAPNRKRPDISCPVSSLLNFYNLVGLQYDNGFPLKHCDFFKQYSSKSPLKKLKSSHSSSKSYFDDLEKLQNVLVQPVTCTDDENEDYYFSD